MVSYEVLYLCKVVSIFYYNKYTDGWMNKQIQVSDISMCYVMYTSWFCGYTTLLNYVFC